MTSVLLSLRLNSLLLKKILANPGCDISGDAGDYTQITLLHTLSLHSSAPLILNEYLFRRQQKNYGMTA